MPDLFNAPVIAGLDYRENFISEAEQDALVAHLEKTELTPFRFHGWTGNRKTTTFGWRYDFDDSSFAPAEPIPEWLHPLRARAAAFAQVVPDDFAHVLLARYDPGAGIGWHRDRPQFEQVVGVSLGSPATMRFRQRTECGFRRANVHLEPRSAYLLSDEVRHDWEHSIVPGETLRFSITFRTLSERGRKLAAQPDGTLRFRNGCRGVRNLFLLAVALCAACSKGPQADAPSISKARSLAAEWALINQQAAEQKLTRTYVATMRSSIREQLQTTAKALSQPHSAYGSEIQALLEQPADAPPQQLRGHATRLKQIEDSLESA